MGSSFMGTEFQTCKIKRGLEIGCTAMLMWSIHIKTGKNVIFIFCVFYDWVRGKSVSGPNDHKGPYA